MATSKGMFWTTKRLLYAIYEKAGGANMAFGLVSSLVNEPNGRGAGCAAWLQIRFV